MTVSHHVRSPTGQIKTIRHLGDLLLFFLRVLGNVLLIRSGVDRLTLEKFWVPDGHAACLQGSRAGTLVEAMYTRCSRDAVYLGVCSYNV